VRSRVADALARDPALADASIVVDVPDGAVRLSGRVATRADQLTALTIARDAAPARAVIDALQIQPAPDGATTDGSRAAPET
jgi:osmotically-inducible protein OsmY